ncbi:MAG: hypothetical protein CMP10_00720 [Zetaproteobacteria bacterium]|nr:hypothetical protein [Pseudobdellovibrionaceae bacterium]
MRRISSIIPLLTLLSLFQGSCGTKSATSNLNVINGKSLRGNDFSQVVLIQGCTGTFIDGETLVTAAHCVMDKMGKPKEKVWIYKDEAYLWSSSIIIHPKYSFSDRNGVNQYDMAMIKVPVGTAKNWAPLCKIGPMSNTTGTLVGWGCNDVSNGWEACDGMGLKRSGYTRITGMDEGMLEAAGETRSTDDTGYGSTSALGDSGGPVFFNDCVGAVVSGGTKIYGVPHSYYADLTTKEAKAFFSEHGFKQDHATADRIDQCITSNNGMFSFYRNSGDCENKKPEKWTYLANYGKDGVYGGTFTSDCNGYGVAEENLLSSLDSRQEFATYDIRWKSWEKSTWTPRDGNISKFDLECVDSEATSKKKK